MKQTIVRIGTSFVPSKEFRYHCPHAIAPTWAKRGERVKKWPFVFTSYFIPLSTH